MATARRKLSQKGLEFIARHEGFRSLAYNDAVGFATIGYGHLLHRGPVNAADRKLAWTREKGLAVLRADIARFEKAVNDAVKVELTQAQFDALVSFAFNVGAHAMKTSTLVRLLNLELREDAADQFGRWNKGGGKVIAGLTTRRRNEKRLFLTGLYTTPAPKPAKKPIVKRKPAVPFARGPSANFTWHEVHRGRKPWNPVLRARAILHARKLERLRTAVNSERAKRGLKPTSLNVLSWYRPEWYNTMIGGARASRHIKADGTDISLQEIGRVFPWKGGNLLFDRLCNTIFKTGGFGQYPAGSRHVDSRGYRARWSSWSR